jgi:hypothetical protein
VCAVDAYYSGVAAGGWLLVGTEAILRLTNTRSYLSMQQKLEDSRLISSLTSSPLMQGTSFGTSTRLSLYQWLPQGNQIAWLRNYTFIRHGIFAN